MKTPTKAFLQVHPDKLSLLLFLLMLWNSYNLNVCVEVQLNTENSESLIRSVLDVLHPETSSDDRISDSETSVFHCTTKLIALFFF